MAENTSSVLSGIRKRPLLVTFAVLTLGFLGAILAQLVRGDLAPSTLGTFVWEGVVFGIIIGLAGIGLAMTYSILNFANFAHGDTLTVGAFLGWSVAFVVAGFGEHALGTLVLVGEPERGLVGELGMAVTTTPVAIAIGFLAATFLTAGVALLIDRFVFLPMRDQSGVALLIASVGVALALRHVIEVIYQPTSPQVTFEPDVGSITIPLGAGSVSVGAHQLTVVIIALILMIGVHVLLQYTKLGTAMRAMSDNEDLAKVTGIPNERIIFYTWVIGGSLTGAAGFLVGLEAGGLQSSLGWDLLLLIFSAVILGGIGSIYGAIVGGLIIGVITQVAQIWVPTQFAPAFAFIVMIVILLVRPSGIFGGVTSV